MSTTTKTINAGPVGLKPKGAYNQGADYTLLDCVLYNYDSWVCVAMNPDGSAAVIRGEAPSDQSTNWLALTDGGRAAVAVAGQVRSEFDEWFGATAAEGIRHTVDAWLTSTQSDWEGWSTAQKQAWSTWFGQQQSAWTAMSEAVTTATTRANTAAEVCENLNAHPAYIADGTQQKPGDVGYWYIWDYTNQVYVKGSKAKGDDLDWDSMSEEDKEELAQKVLDHIIFDDEPVEDSDHAVKSGGLYDAFADKQDKLTFASDAECEAAAGEIVFTVAPEPEPEPEEQEEQEEEPSGEPEEEPGE